MSMSLEERRAERRRKRQMEEETSHSGTKSADEIHADIQERLARRRKERDDRIANLAVSVATVNGEDDLERRRRERREQRLRASGDTDYTSTDDYSSRRNRRRGTDDNTAEDTSSYSSYRSRRHRNWDDEETPTVNEVPVSSVPDTSEEDRRQRQREEEQEEERRQAEREAEEERQRQAALEDERRREEERRSAEEERQRQEARRLAEEERERQEEEERRRFKQDDEADFESESEGSSDDDNYKQHRTENKLFIEEDDLVATDIPVDKFERVRQWNEESNNVDNVERQNSENTWNKNENSEKSKTVDRSGSFKEINNNKIRDKLDKFEHLKYESDNKTVNNKSVLIPLVEKDGLKGKLQKFEQEIKEQEILAKDPPRHTSRTGRLEVSTPQPHRLTEKVQQFETAARSKSASKPSSKNAQFELANLGSVRRQRQSMLGRWSISESHINKTDSKDAPKRNVLDRWKSVDKQHQQTPNLTSPTEKKEQLNKRLSGNTEFIASKYLEKASKSVEEPQILKTPVSSLQKTSSTQPFDQKLTSHSAEIQSDVSKDISSNQSKAKVTSRWQITETQSEVLEETPVKQSKAKITNRWPFNEDNENFKSTPKTGQSGSQSRSIHSRESSSDFTHSHSRGSSIDGSSESSKRSSHQLQQEEEEEERFRQEKEERMAAEEGQKKRTKRKGLGGLTPEKKKKLKQIIMQKAAEDLKKEALAKAQEKEKFINDRVGPFNTEGLGEAELRKLIKSLHEKLAQIHSEAYDIEFKLNKQEKEIVDLNMKISDSRGKFAKPVLRKVNKTEQKFAKMAKQASFRETLQSAHDDDAN